MLFRKIKLLHFAYVENGGFTSELLMNSYLFEECNVTKENFDSYKRRKALIYLDKNSSGKSHIYFIKEGYDVFKNLMREFIEKKLENYLFQ